MKIALLTRGGFDNPKIWSGTPSTIFRKMEQIENVQITTADMELPRGFRGLYYHSLCSVFFFMYHTHDFLLRPIFGCILRHIFKKIGKQDYTLQINDYYIPDFLRKYGKHAIYIDAHRPDWWKELCKGDKRILRDTYTKDFNHATKKSLLNADLIFTQNEWTRQGMIRDFGINPDIIFNVRFGVNLQPLFEEKDYSKNMMLIVLREGFEEPKGLNLLLKAFPLVRKQVKNVELAVVGSSVGKGIEGVTNYVNQPREVTVKLFKECTLYVMPALAEPNGITYLEALANKVPIVGLNRYALPEFTGNGEWGFLCENEEPKELANVIVKALSDKIRLKGMGEKGQKFVIENYNWDMVIANMINLMKTNK